MEWRHTEHPHGPGKPSAPRGRILIVDDEAVVCETVDDILSEAGFVCLAKTTARDALQSLREDYFDCLVSDVRMPGLDGIQLLREARRIDPDLEVVLMTGLVDAATAIEALKTGASDYVMKPFDVEEIIHCVRRAVEHRRLTLENREYQEHLEQQVAKQATTIREQFLSAIHSLAKAVEARDPYTHGHSDRVSHLAGKIAKHLGVGAEDCNIVILAGLLHDIGKIGVPDKVLQKRRALSKTESRVMQAHPVIGRDIVAQIAPPSTLIDGILHHHERWDGQGYPEGRQRDRIPLVARILAAADTFDAMTSARPYRLAFSKEQAAQKIADCRGSQLDPDVVDAMLPILRNGHSKPEEVSADGWRLRQLLAKSTA